MKKRIIVLGISLIAIVWIIISVSYAFLVLEEHKNKQILLQVDA